MAMAVTELFPGTLLTIGPVIENGFYYDFDSPHKFSPEDFPAIEEKMKELAKRDFPVERSEMPRQDAIAYFKDPSHREPYKVEMMEEWTDDSVSFYKQGPFSDLCRGPHVPNTAKLQHFKLLSVAGAYWRGDEKRPMLQRIYATAFLTKDDLEKHLFQLEEAKKRDHRKVGKELDYFHLEEGSPGMVFWHPRGWRLYSTLMEYIRAKLSRRGYQEVRTPEVVDKTLYVKSGHVANYADLMFFTESENREFVIKPMNCPCHVEIFKQGTKSFRDLPIRLAEFGKCHRNELAGVMHGLMRVRGFTQDDAHIFCTVEQIADEVADFCRLLQEVYSDFGFTDIIVKLADRPEKRVGSDEVWTKAEEALKEACQRAQSGLCHERRRRRLLRSQAGVHPQGFPRPSLAMRHHPGGLQYRRSPGRRICRLGRIKTPSGHAAPGHPGVVGAVYRHPDRKFRRGFALVDQSPANPHSARFREVRGCGPGIEPENPRCRSGLRSGHPKRQDRLQNPRRGTGKGPLSRDFGR